MDCNQARPLIDADTDGELDLVRHLELAAHLRTCAECTRHAETARARRAALRESLPRFTAPPQLAGKIRAALQAGGMPASAGAPARRPSLFWPVWNVAGLAASLAFAVLVGFAWGHARARANLLVDEAVADHVRSLQAGHLMDVASTDQHTVKPWFAGKLDFAPPVTDLAAAGFPLTGGRLEHLDGRPAAALVFHRRQHAINLFIWPADPIAARRSGASGYNTESWSQGGLNFLAVSEMPAAELAQFVAAFRAAGP
ncbi:zf-HC2 domain-containing protein [Opitutus sp. GAS368]|uniref:anti-sigma factor family protein n=1 Tax=Opitutus sp. GAS368 TaxID=1882749 RepID=UPI00087BF65C|nr:zf-HC2 domain-containing protein [Opitutus sp. GAS368]SDS30426.1 Transmembrane transcriptional regulator (anti-sigma factor RsiW) [Opitutus sp. GAS368]